MMRGKRNDLEGRTFGKLTVLRLAGNAHGLIWQCQCDCGRLTATRADKLLAGKARSCGEPGCRRDTLFVQDNNGQRKMLIELVDGLGLSRGTVYARLRRGWSLDQALGLPPRKRRAA